MKHNDPRRGEGAATGNVWNLHPPMLILVASQYAGYYPLGNFGVGNKLPTPCYQWIEHGSTLWQHVAWWLQPTTCYHLLGNFGVGNLLPIPKLLSVW